MTALHLTVVPEPGSAETNMESAQELAWNHVMAMVGRGIEVGDDIFVGIYQVLLYGYTQCAEHFGFIQHLALRAVQEMLSSNQVTPNLPPSRENTEHTIHMIQVLAQSVTSAMMYLVASQEVSWIPNDEWQSIGHDTRGVTFVFDIEEGEAS
jgi:hypothetical protein